MKVEYHRKYKINEREIDERKQYVGTRCHFDLRIVRKSQANRPRSERDHGDGQIGGGVALLIDK